MTQINGTIDLDALAGTLCKLGGVGNVRDLGSAGPMRASADDTGLFHCLFGRDAIRMALDLLEDFPEVARTTLVTLAMLQGVRMNARSEEEPGRFLHEHRMPDDPHAVRLNEFWDWPYYGAVDTTPQWINLLTMYTAVQGFDILREELTDRRSRIVSIRDSLVSAVEWLLGRLDDASGAGYLWVRRASDSGNRSQVWEDSSDAFHDENGILFDASRPFAPVAAQGYAYDALLGAANLLEHSNVLSARSPSELRRRAVQLRAMTLRHFWQPDLRTFAHALTIDAHGVATPVRIVASAPGHLLATKILDGAEFCRLRDTLASRLLEDDMLAGAGIRTKSTRDPLFRPGAYHNGSVWPMDTGVIADGLRQHGYVEQADDLENRIISACATVGDFPEFFRGDLDGRVSINRESLTYLRDGRLHFREQPPQIHQGWTTTRVWRILRRRGAVSPDL
ncbi:hypothetical protein [Mesorhizobium sp. M0633]|uniref:amylo-alpha-1,6-glucosidase n=1 Tax=Mesorhizobium sp. M0633 TaxID=2956977 RepID=UPI0033382E94